MAETRAANPVPLGAAGPKQPVRVEDAYFDVEVCRNCAAPLLTPFCGACGQKKARRLSWRDLRRETWEHWRLFEISSVQTLRRLITQPGYVAREYVMGMRKKHMHPLKLLAFLVVILILVLARNSFFEYFHYSTRADAEVDRMAKLVQAYANWSFTTGIGAIFIASWSVYRRRLGYNSIEHLVLAVYCQILILAAIILATATLFVDYTIVHPILAVGYIVLVAASFSLLGFILGLWAEGFEKLQMIPMLVLMPLTFLGGTFYSIDMLPAPWRTLTLFNPVVYLVSGFRWSFYGLADVNVGISVVATLVFLALCLAGVWWIFRTGWHLKP